MNIAIQMYTLRHAPESLDAQLAAIAAAGYQGIETVGTQGCSAPELLSLLDKHGLQVCSSHVALEQLRSQLDEAIDFAQAIGNDSIVMPYLSADHYDHSEASWQKIGKELDQIGQRCRAKGIQLMYHNHDFELFTIGDRTALEHLLDSASPEHLGAELDLAWLLKGGAEPAYFLDKYAGRCSRVHLKDIAVQGENVDQDGWADVGEGVVDFASLLPLVEAAGSSWGIVEHDLPQDPLATMRRSATNLKQLLS